MKVSRLTQWTRVALCSGAMLSLCATGCMLQTTVGGQTLPSAYYLRDDVQYFPAGPEFRLTNQVRALEEYKLNQQAAQQGIAAPPVGGVQ